MLVAQSMGAGYPTEFDGDTYLLPDVPQQVLGRLPGDERTPSDTPFGQPCTFERWPDVSLHVLTGADDRFHPLDLQRRVASRCRIPVAMGGADLLRS